MIKKLICIRDIDSREEIINLSKPDGYNLPSNGYLWLSNGKFYAVEYTEEGSEDLVEVRAINKPRDIMYYPDELGFLIPEGMIYDKRVIPDGIWYCHHSEYSSGITSVSYIAESVKAKPILDENGKPLYGIYKLGDKSLIDIETLCGIDDLADKILTGENYKTIFEGDDKASTIDIVRRILTVAVEECQKLKEK